MEKGKELECSRRAGGGKGSGIREADSDDRGFPLAILACFIMPVAFYYLMAKTISSAGNGFILGSVVSVLLWIFVGSKYVK
jgi:hypothetical protein